MPTFHIGNVPVEFVELGSGDPVVLLHSSGSSRAQWRALIDRLSRDFRVLAPDLYGYGATGAWPSQAPFTLEDEAQIVLTLLERCGEPAHLVGHSYGGAVALHVARKRGDLVRSLAVIEPVAFHLLRDGDDEDDAALAEVAHIAGTVERSLDRRAPGRRFRRRSARPSPRTCRRWRSIFAQPSAIRRVRATSGGSRCRRW